MLGRRQRLTQPTYSHYDTAQVARRGMPRRLNADQSRTAHSPQRVPQARPASTVTPVPPERSASTQGAAGPTAEKENQMPKLKTKSGAKKRFRMTATGRVKVGAQGKRHGMIKRTAKFVRS